MNFCTAARCDLIMRARICKLCSLTNLITYWDLSVLFIDATVCDRRMNVVYWWNDTVRLQANYSEETSPNATVFSKIPLEMARDRTRVFKTTGPRLTV